MAEKVLIYAGTTEGRLLAQELSRAHIACDVHVATEYGQMVMPELAGVKVCVGRLDVEEMRALLKKNGQNNSYPAFCIYSFIFLHSDLRFIIRCFAF